MSPVFLIVGGSSVAGQAALQVLRRRYPDARLVTTSSQSQSKKGNHVETIDGIDLKQSDAVQKLLDALNHMHIHAIDGLVYTPAFGPIGYPVLTASAEDIQQALSFSVQPMIELHKALQSPRTTGFTAFYWLPHTLTAYGSMAFAKFKQEQLAIRDHSFQMIRAGTFVSRSTRGIGLLLQRLLRDTPHPQLQELGRLWKESGRKFSDFFFDYAFQSEQQAFGSRFAQPHRPTEQRDLERAIERSFEDDRPPIVNVIGDWLWVEDKLPELPPELERMASLQ